LHFEIVHIRLSLLIGDPLLGAHPKQPIEQAINFETETSSKFAELESKHCA